MTQRDNFLSFEKCNKLTSLPQTANYFVFLSFLFAEKQLGDGVLAVVGTKVVLFSSVLDETNLTAQEKNLSPQKNFITNY